MGGGPEDVDQNSDWFVWARDRANIERGLVSGDLPEDGPAFFKTFKEDLDRAKDELHTNSIRISIEWSRIFPNPTFGVKSKVSVDGEGMPTSVEIDEDSMKALDQLADRNAIERYREILEYIREKDMIPIVTVNHFTLPLWLHDPIRCRDDVERSERRGWIDRKAVVEFCKYAAYLAKTFGGLVDIWATINEPTVIALAGYFMGDVEGFPPGLGRRADLALMAMQNLALAHSRAYEQIKRWDKSSASQFGPSLVGPVVNLAVIEPYDASNTDDVAIARLFSYVNNEWYLNAAVHGLYDNDLDFVIGPGEMLHGVASGADFLGINYYTRFKVRAGGGLMGAELVGCEGECTDMGWEVYAKGLREVLEWAYNKYRLPLIVTENGIADERDAMRESFLRRHLEQLHDAIEIGHVPVKGYFYWSLMDNFEWAKGFGKRFGLYGVDYATKRRKMRESAKYYGEVCRDNGLPG